MHGNILYVVSAILLYTGFRCFIRCKGISFLHRLQKQKFSTAAGIDQGPAALWTNLSVLLPHSTACCPRSQQAPTKSHMHW